MFVPGAVVRRIKKSVDIWGKMKDNFYVYASLKRLGGAIQTVRKDRRDGYGKEKRLDPTPP